MPGHASDEEITITVGKARALTKQLHEKSFRAGEEAGLSQRPDNKRSGSGRLATAATEKFLTSTNPEQRRDFAKGASKKLGAIAAKTGGIEGLVIGAGSALLGRYANTKPGS